MKNKKILSLAVLFVLVFSLSVSAQMPEDHNQLWEYMHGVQAKNSTKDCMTCHETEKNCLDCHKTTFNSKNKPRSHKGGYEFLHQLDAKRNASTCSTCHEVDSCLKCHQSLNKAKSATVASPSQPQSHSLTNWRTALHGPYAKRNLKQCQSCHPDSYTVSPCTTCHSGSSNISGKPHPDNYVAGQFADLTVCYKCHGTGTSDGTSAGPLSQ